MAAIGNKTEISPHELKKLVDDRADIAILDIRDQQELAICSLPESIHIPMSELSERVGELSKFKDKEIVVYCRSGGRSARCVAFLRGEGYAAINLTGGILAWSDDVDASVQKY